MWSASTWKGRVQSSSLTAARAAASTLGGREPTIVCSRCDLFQTGVTSTPRAAACAHARNCAFAWCAKRSPTPKEYFSNFRALPIVSSLILTRTLMNNYQCDVGRKELTTEARRALRWHRGFEI